MRGLSDAKRILALGATLGLLTGCGVASPFASTAEPSRLHARSTGSLSLLVLPDDGVTPILSAIQGAKKSIQLEMYMLTDHDLTDQIVQALIARAKAGVNVQVLLDPHPFTGPKQPGQPDQDVNATAAQALTAGGVQVKRTSTTFAFTHE